MSKQEDGGREVGAENHGEQAVSKVETVEDALAQARAEAARGVADISKNLDELGALEKMGKINSVVLGKIGEIFAKLFEAIGYEASRMEGDKYESQLSKTILAGMPLLTMELLAFAGIAIAYNNNVDSSIIDDIMQKISSMSRVDTPLELLQNTAIELGIVFGVPLATGRILQKVIALAYDARQKNKKTL